MPQKITAGDEPVRVKMQGKGLRVWEEIFTQGKPCMLKCHVNPVPQGRTIQPNGMSCPFNAIREDATGRVGRKRRLGNQRPR